jgi:hypothetical protein
MSLTTSELLDSFFFPAAGGRPQESGLLRALEVIAPSDSDTDDDAVLDAWASAPRAQTPELVRASPGVARRSVRTGRASRRAARGAAACAARSRRTLGQA